MKILVFGFKPYQDYEKNISEEIVKRLRCSKNLHCAVLPVNFDKKIFQRIVKKHNPDVIIGLGQHPYARKIRIERKATNRKKTARRSKATKIDPNKPRYQLVSLKLKPDAIARVTYDAGDYVCNFAMYIISDISKRSGIKFAFMHIPRKYNISRAVRFVESKIREVD